MESITLATALTRILRAAPREEGKETYYVIEDGKVVMEQLDVTEDHLDTLASAGMLDGPVAPTGVLHIECNDSGDSFDIQMSGSGMFAVITTHERDWAHQQGLLTADEEEPWIGSIPDKYIQEAILDRETSQLRLPMVGLTPSMGYSLISLLSKALMILTYQRNQTEQGNI